MAIPSFSFSHLPEIHFGPKKISLLPDIISKYGHHVLVITGENSFIHSPQAALLWASFEEMVHCTLFKTTVSGEPSPEIVDQITSQYREKNIDMVVAIGGGSVLDTGKAVAAMFYEKGTSADYLEVVGRYQPSGNKAVFVAVPTTAGTGSELTKNAVLSRPGEHGFKASMRHDNFIPDCAIIDPELMLTCPASVTAACGLDAFTQLLEALVSSKPTPISDALALDGIGYAVESLVTCYQNGKDLTARTNMAYAAMLSGITLANAGLGLVHGFAASIGGMFNIPHGVICGTFLANITEANIVALRKLNDQKTLKKYAQAGAIVLARSSEKGGSGAGAAPAIHGSGNEAFSISKSLGILNVNDSQSLDPYLDVLVATLKQWTNQLQIPKLSQYGVQLSDVPRIVQETGNKNNPVRWEKDQIAELLKARI